MPELPDVAVYAEALTSRIAGRVLDRFRLVRPFVLRSVAPPITIIAGQTVGRVGRLGKRIVLEFESELCLVIHLMIAGRLRWRESGAKLGFGPKIVLASFEFAAGTLFLTEAGSTRRASIELLSNKADLATRDPGGVEPLECSFDQFREALMRQNHTLKRALTDPRLVSGIGNAYSDEILHAARLSPLKLTQSLAVDEVVRLYDATRVTLLDWIARLRRDLGGAFPEKVTAFRDEMAVHGRFRQPCRVCGAPVQRIVYAQNECNYCAKCQTNGRLLADRALSRLLREDWPRTVDEI